MAVQLNMVVGIDKIGNVKGYRVVTAFINQTGPGKFDWKFECRMSSEDEVKNSLMQGQKWLNIEYKNGIKGSTGALSRFETGKNKPFIIISQLIDSTKRLLGYKVANYDGKVKNITLKEMIAYGLRLDSAGEIPVQNAMFVNGQDGSKRAYFKTYPGHKFITEIIEVQKNPNAQKPVRVGVQKNEKALRKLDEIFSPEQIKQLKLGKKEGLDIRLYANPSLSPAQMEVLRMGLQRKVNIKPFASPEYSPELMRGYIYDSQEGIDIRRYLNPKYNVSQLLEVGLAASEGLDISKLSSEKIPASEMAEIRERLESKLWNDIYVKPSLSWEQSKA